METKPVEDGKSRDPAALFNAYVEFMKLTFANLFLLNAGSATALMTFFGGQKKSDLDIHLVTQQGAKWAVTFFAIGAACAVAATAFAGLTESMNAGNLERKEKLSVFLGIASGILVLASGGCFLTACILSVHFGT
jgi:hypothetical protein